MVDSRIMADEQEFASGEPTAAEPGIAPDDGAEARPEIEPEQGPDLEPPKEPIESPVAKVDNGEAGCPIWIDDAPKCGRQIHVAPEGADEEPVCLMHSKDPHKLSDPLWDAFYEEFDRTLEAAGEGEAHFERFVFPQLDLSKEKLEATYRFTAATFTEDADFREATFTEDAGFNRATFTGDADFSGATFTGDADFSGATFTGDADFRGATFTGETDFSGATLTQPKFSLATFTGDADFKGAAFSQDVDFLKATFTGDADFRGATFAGDADFSGATFTQDVTFGYATFSQKANFRGARFIQKSRFSDATFSQTADFGGASFVQVAWFFKATFTGDADFIGVTFTEGPLFVGATFAEDATFNHAVFSQGADFSFTTFKGRTRFLGTEFHGTANWTGDRFLDRAEFRDMRFDLLAEGEPTAVFALANFSKPAEVVFDEVDLSRALFYDCDVSQVCFTSSVRWGRRNDNSGLAVIEEKIPLEHKHTTRLKRGGKRDYGAVAQIYQQLKRSYDSRLDYWTANEFHFGEMEMKRLAVPTNGRLLGVRQWLHRRLSLIALYRYASDYGNSYMKPLLWLLGALVLVTALLPLPGVGLKRQGAMQAETYASVWRAGDGWKPNLWAEGRLVGNGAITSVDTATFQRNPEYTPAYPWGRLLAILETLLTSTLFGLFLLAIRRQFRR